VHEASALTLAERGVSNKQEVLLIIQYGRLEEASECSSQVLDGKVL
jgi:hypothetical protein